MLASSVAIRVRIRIHERKRRAATWPLCGARLSSATETGDRVKVALVVLHRLPFLVLVLVVVVGLFGWIVLHQAGASRQTERRERMVFTKQRR